jgi:hypothetical protein
MYTANFPAATPEDWQAFYAYRDRIKMLKSLAQDKQAKNMVDCQVAVQPVGWLLTFPGNPQAAWVFFTDSEKVDFINSCSLDLAGADPLLVELAEIERCPEYWYLKACEFQPPF